MRKFRRDAPAGPPFPGVVLPREQWSRTRVGLGREVRPFDWLATFGREAPRVVDLGCGNGRYLVGSALVRRDRDHLGVELVPPALRLGSLRAGQRGLTNLKFAWGDANEFIARRCPRGSIHEAHLYHPQPYYDRSKLDRRQLTPQTLAAIHRALAPGGLFVFQTDNPAYWSYAGEVAPALFEWRVVEGPWPDAPEGRTLREIVARSKGLAVYRAVGVRIDLDDDALAQRVAEMPMPDFDANKPGYGAEEEPGAEPAREAAPRKGPPRFKRRRRGGPRA